MKFIKKYLIAIAAIVMFVAAVYLIGNEVGLW